MSIVLQANCVCDECGTTAKAEVEPQFGSLYEGDSAFGRITVPPGWRCFSIGWGRRVLCPDHVDRTVPPGGPKGEGGET